MCYLTWRYPLIDPLQEDNNGIVEVSDLTGLTVDEAGTLFDM